MKKEVNLAKIEYKTDKITKKEYKDRVEMIEQKYK